jgi:hypothetical protein
MTYKLKFIFAFSKLEKESIAIAMVVFYHEEKTKISDA